jgi:hypothetical protein
MSNVVPVEDMTGLDADPCDAHRVWRVLQLRPRGYRCVHDEIALVLYLLKLVLRGRETLN